MQALSIEEIRHYLDLAAEVGRSFPVIDVHVHGTEIIFRQLEYLPSAPGDEIRSAVPSPFLPPRIQPLELEDDSRLPDRFGAGVKNRVSRLFFTQTYQHIGRRVLLDHMGLGGVGIALLLPVAPADGPVEDQMQTLKEIRGPDRRLLLGYSVPSAVPNGEVARDLDRVIAGYDVKAVKLHPNISRIDPATSHGMERVESILGACSRARLPLIVHGGRSPILGDDRTSHAVLGNLEQVDWARCTEHVVIAHCGIFGCGGDEIAAEGIPTLKRILARHGNVLVDTSGVSLPVLVDMLKHLDHERIVFGSDALYFSMWRAVVTLLHALRTAGFPLEDSFARIAAHNARTRLRLGPGGP